MEEICYLSGDENLVGEIGSLWEGLNRIHREKSPHFGELYARRTFDERKRDLLVKAKEGRLHVIIARDAEGHNIGYCISTIKGASGEIESIYLDPANRKHGIGQKLMEDSLEWLRAGKAADITVKVSVGNEDAFGFYERFGFFPRLTELKLK
jgi:ribosomal protein S18 acetylase RimI-like enzyme